MGTARLTPSIAIKPAPRRPWSLARLGPLEADGARTLVTLGVLSGLLYGAVHVLQVVLVHDVDDHGRQLVELVGYELAVVGLLVTYAQVLHRCRENQLGGPRIRWLAVALPVLFWLGFVLSAPLLSPDSYSYLAFGYIGATPGGNVYYQEARTILGTDFGSQLVALGWPGAGLSPYGPLWNDLEVGIVSLSRNIAIELLLIKSLVVAASLGGAAVVAWIMKRVDPANAQLALLAYLWNPLLILLIGGDGHNEGLLALLMLTSLALTVRGHVGGGVVVQVLAVLTKFLPIVLLPIQMAYWWWTAAHRAQLLARLAVGVAIAAALVIVFYQPVWLGLATFMGTGALGDGKPASQAANVEQLFVLIVRCAAIAAVVFVVAWRARDRRRLLLGCAAAMLFVVEAGPQHFAPWYAATPLALLVLSPRRDVVWLILVLSGCALAIVPLDMLSVTGSVSFEAAAWASRVARALPLLCGLGFWLNIVLREHAGQQQLIGQCSDVLPARRGRPLNQSN